MTCNKCGSKIREEEKFCRKCGTMIDRTQISKEYERFVIIVILICIIIFSGIHFFGNSIIENIKAQINNIKDIAYTKEYSVSTSGHKTTIKVNERIIDQAIQELEFNGYIVHEKMYVKYDNNKAKQYIVVAEINPKNELYETFGVFYYVRAIDAKTGDIKSITTANKDYGIDYIIREALSSKEVVNGQLGEFRYRKDYIE